MTQIAGSTATPTFVAPAEVKPKDTTEVQADTLVAQAETTTAKPTEAEVKANEAALAQVDQKA